MQLTCAYHTFHGQKKGRTRCHWNERGTESEAALHSFSTWQQHPSPTDISARGESHRFQGLRESGSTASLGLGIGQSIGGQPCGIRGRVPLLIGCEQAPPTSQFVNKSCKDVLELLTCRYGLQKLAQLLVI